MKTLTQLIHVFLYLLFTLFLIGLFSQLGETYGNIAVASAFIFWGSVFFIKYKKMEKIATVSSDSSSIQSERLLSDSAPQTTSKLDHDKQEVQSHETQSTQEKSEWVMVIAVMNIIIFFIAVPICLFLWFGMSVVRIDNPSNTNFIDTFILFFPLLLFIYFITTVITVYRSFSKTSPIVSVKDSEYILLWPITQLAFIIICSYFILSF